MALVVLMLQGAGWVTERLLPWFIYASALGLGFLILVVLPLSLFRRCRGFASIASLVVSYVFGATLWMWGLLLTLGLWGPWAVIIGLCMMGIGVVPIAMFATLFNAMWSILAQLILLTIVTFGTRYYSFWIASDGTD